MNGMILNFYKPNWSQDQGSNSHFSLNYDNVYIWALEQPIATPSIH